MSTALDASVLRTVVVLVGLGASLTAAVVRPRRLPEAVVAVLAAAAVLAIGAVSLPTARAEVGHLLPVVGFLVAALVLAHLSSADGLFEAVGARVSRSAGSAGRHRLFDLLFLFALVTTVLLSLDTTVVLATPVVLAAARRARAPVPHHALTTVHLANSGSLLLPVSNLSNLLVVAASGIGFLRFTALMAAPAVVAAAVEYVVLRLLARGVRSPPVGAGGGAAMPALPRVATGVVGATLAAVVVCGALGVEPVWPMAAGALVLLVRAVRVRPTAALAGLRAGSPDFAVFVLAIGVVVAALTAGPVGQLVGSLLPSGDGLLPLLAVAGIAAVLANLVNNLPATLLVVGLLGTGDGTLPVLAALVGLNVGPNLTYPGSLATLLWRRIVPREDRPTLAAFTRAGLATVPATLLLSVAALWAAGHVLAG